MSLKNRTPNLPTHVVGVRMPQESWYRLRLISATLNRTQSEVIDYALRLLAVEENIPIPTDAQVTEWSNYRQQHIPLRPIRERPGMNGGDESESAGEDAQTG